MWLPGAKYHDHMIRALPCKQLNEKSKGKQITGKLRIHELFCTGKNLTAMFSSVQSLNSSGSVIIMDIYTVGAKILAKALLIAMWNWGCTGWEIIFDKNSFPGLLRWKLVWDCCWISFSFPCTEVALPEDAFRRSHDWEHVTVGFNSLIGLVCRYGLDLPRLTVIGREHCDKCSSEAAVCEMWLYAGSLWHLFHHAIECSCAKRCVAKPDFVVGGIELLALAIYWSQDIWRWVEMVQVVLERFYWTPFRSQNGKYLRVWLIFSISEAALVIFCRLQGTGLTSVQFVVFNALWSFS